MHGKSRQYKKRLQSQYIDHNEDIFILTMHDNP